MKLCFPYKAAPSNYIVFKKGQENVGSVFVKNEKGQLQVSLTGNNCTFSGYLEYSDLTFDEVKLFTVELVQENNDGSKIIVMLQVFGPLFHLEIFSSHFCIGKLFVPRIFVKRQRKRITNSGRRG